MACNSANNGLNKSLSTWNAGRNYCSRGWGCSELACDCVRAGARYSETVPAVAYRLDRTKPNKNHYYSTIRDDVVEYSSVIIIISWFSLRLADDETVFGSPWSPDRPSSFRSPAKSAEVDRMLVNNPQCILGEIGRTWGYYLIINNNYSLEEESIIASALEYHRIYGVSFRDGELPLTWRRCGEADLGWC